MRKVWMQVSSSNSYADDELRTRYYEGSDLVVVELGSGRLLMTADVAEQLFGQLREAINDEQLVRAEKSGEPAHLITAYREITVVPSEEASTYRQRLAELRRKAVA